MKKINLLIACLFFNIIFLLGQQENIIKTFEDQLNGNLNLSNGNITIEKSNKTANADNRIILKNAQLKNGDLIINFDLAEFRSPEKKLSLKIQPSVNTQNGEILLAQPKFLEGNFENAYNAKPQQLQLKWNNFQNQYRFGAESIIVKLDGQLIGVPPLDCNNPPIFGKQQKLLHYVIGGLSAGSVITGFVLDDSGKEAYQQYRNEVFEGEPDATATSTYNKANRRNQTGGLMKTVGFTAFGLNAAVYIFRQVRYNQKKKDYDYYCEQKKWRVEPYLNMQSENAYAGMQMAFTF